jgi:predicted heme/steroid binding protein
MAFDADNAKLYIGINGTYYNLSGNPEILRQVQIQLIQA